MTTDAQKMVAMYFEKGLSNNTRTATKFLQHLNTVFIDPNGADRALSKLRHMDQGRDSFAVFLPKFERVLHESGLEEDRAMISYLKGGINDELHAAMVRTDPARTYQQYISQLFTIASQLEECRFASRRHRTATAPAAPAAFTPVYTPTRDPQCHGRLCRGLKTPK